MSLELVRWASDTSPPEVLENGCGSVIEMTWELVPTWAGRHTPAAGVRYGVP